jgi:hypothetical protein
MAGLAPLWRELAHVVAGIERRLNVALEVAAGRSAGEEDDDGQGAKPRAVEDGPGMSSKEVSGPAM